MGLNKSGVKKGNSEPQDSRLLGITDKVIPTDQSGNSIVNLPASLNNQARRNAVAQLFRVELYKAQAIILIRQTCIR
ncbi:MAG: hypothetical protein JSW53_00805 [Candidatus Bathyarchaeota archaeon]|nr:MAG: hypothetical protein JSW53_00805 [Candidatus Bathyarchaeota archaeon]